MVHRTLRQLSNVPDQKADNMENKSKYRGSFIDGLGVLALS